MSNRGKPGTQRLASASKKPGQIVIISSPSGGGKTSICRKLLSRSRKAAGWQFSVSYTTRRKRPGERNGREYWFVSDEEFSSLAGRKAFAEHFRVHRFHYGTPRKPLERVLTNGGVMLLDVDVQGAFKLKKEYPQAITVFVLPPSIPALRRRLKQRGTETKEQLAVRFETAKKEMKLFRKFEYAVVNDQLSTAVRKVLSIIAAHPCRTQNLSMEQMKRIVG